MSRSAAFHRFVGFSAFFPPRPTRTRLLERKEPRMACGQPWLVTLKSSARVKRSSCDQALRLRQPIVAIIPRAPRPASKVAGSGAWAEVKSRRPP